METQLIGDLAQRERPHREVSVLEEIPLPRDYGLRDALNGEESLLEIADEPAGFLQMLGEQRGLSVPGLTEVVRVLLVDADARIDRRVDRDNPALLFLANDHVRNDCARFERPYLGTRPRVEAADQLHGDAQLFLRTAQRLQQSSVVARGYQRQPVVHDVERELASACFPVHGLQLQRQALRQIPRRDAGRLQRLHDAQRRFKLARGCSGGQRCELFQRLTQEAILIERIDDQIREHVIALGESEQEQLLAQGAAQRGWGGGPLGPVRGVIGAVPAWARKIEVGLPGLVRAIVLGFGARIRCLEAFFEEWVLGDRLVQFLHTLERR